MGALGGEREGLRARASRASRGTTGDGGGVAAHSQPEAACGRARAGTGGGSAAGDGHGGG